MLLKRGINGKSGGLIIVKKEVESAINSNFEGRTNKEQLHCSRVQ